MVRRRRRAASAANNARPASARALSYATGDLLRHAFAMAVFNFADVLSFRGVGGRGNSANHIRNGVHDLSRTESLLDIKFNKYLKNTQGELLMAMAKTENGNNTTANY
ncbi:hypothetical protein EVAR_38303_1 [Eumeta japonica]|uniref:Uncharacterized protein n=1 Tax=Eumeta variegata TaxID=151549 RepID=A0A4C1W7Y9_EUMVA|nr:hypothetical protein EVAR_38303_1 [Eumeta japonica]